MKYCLQRAGIMHVCTSKVLTNNYLSEAFAEVGPTVSIAMTTFNGVDYVARQLSSIASQTYQPLEIIISDDGSTDGTLQELESLRKIIPFQLFTRDTPLGVNANLAFTLQQCTGDLIAIADQDDIWELEKIQVLVGALGDYDAVFSDSSLIDQYDQSLGTTLMRHLLRKTPSRVCIEPMSFIVQNIVSGHALLFRRKLLPSALPFVTEYLYDQQLAIVACIGSGIAYVDRSLVRHRQHASNTNNQLFSKVQKERTPRLVRSIRMALQLRAGIKYASDASMRMGGNRPSMRRIQRLSRLLDADSLLKQWFLFFNMMLNQAKLLPYQPLSRRFKLVRRMVVGLQNTQAPKD